MDPWSSGGLLTHHSRGWHGDEEGLRWWFPSPAGCREELLDPPDLGTTMVVAACSMFRGKVIVPLGFSWQREFIGERAMSGSGPGPTPLGGVARGGPRHPMVRPPPSPPPSLIWTPSSCQLNFGFRFIQFQEYFLCNFSKTLKQQRTGTSTVASR
jgi:hypothetical protein